LARAASLYMLVGSARADVPETQTLLSFHQDNYFITGFTESTQVKFQFSVKYDLWPNAGQNAMYFAFTQLSLWDIYDSSSPFLENNYSPEFFYIYFHHPGRYYPPPGCSFFHEQLGYQHQSNGEPKPLSRGWDRIYGESRFACYAEKRFYGLATLKVWAPPFGKGDNPDIVKFLGYGVLSLSQGIEANDSWYGDYDVTVSMRKGTGAIGYGSIEIDGKWRPRFFSYSRFTPFLYVQFFTGYGETLLTYNVALTAFRVGFAFSDRSTREQ
jgi:phospholipase A1